MKSTSSLGSLTAVVLTLAAVFTTGCSDTPKELAWCDVQPILQNKCQRCHQDPQKNGAPFPLLQYSDTQEPYATPTDPDRKRYGAMLAAVESNYMPFMDPELDPPVQPLTCEERTTLLTWLRSNAPQGDGCSDGPQELDCAASK